MFTPDVNPRKRVTYKLRPSNGGWRSVGCKGTAYLPLPLRIGNRTYRQQVLIKDIKASFVLGYDFLFDKQRS